MFDLSKHRYGSILSKLTHRTSVFAAALALTACHGGGDGSGSTIPAVAADTAHQFKVTRTTEGMAQITAPNLAAASAGLGYSYAQDNFCLLQDYLLTVNGERSKYLGPTATVLTQVAHVQTKNLESDFFYKFYVDAASADALYAKVDQASTDMIAGYVAGVNRYFQETGADKVDATCRGKPWLRAMTLTDMHKVLVDKAILSSGANFIEPIAGAQPPAAATAALATKIKLAGATPASLGLPPPPIASNGWAFGRDKVEGGGAVLMGNPHFPWVTTNRFFEARMTVPGLYDVTGVALGGLPIMSIGYNKSFSWSHTISTGKRFTLYELALKSGDPRTYIVDGVEKPMTPVDVPVDVLSNGAVTTQTRRLYKTDFGAMLVIPTAGLSWSATRAYALSDVNLTNNRFLPTWLKLGQATTVREAQSVLSQTLGIPWVNTIAADSTGEVLYADITPVPNIDTPDLTRCAPSPQAAALLNIAGLVVLNGSTAQCKWTVDPTTPVPGVIPASKLASAVRTDFVSNENDSYWLANPAITWPTFSPMLGPVNVAQRPRTRAALTTFQRRFAGTDGLPGNLMSADKLQTIWYRNENYMSSIVLDDLLALCASNPTVTLASGTTVSTAAACTALSAWDRRSNQESKGAHVFREFWRSASTVANVYAVPFSASDPVNTPRGLNTGDATAKAAILQAFGKAIDTFQTAGVAMDATLGSIQYVTVNGQQIPYSAGEEFEGTPNKQESYGFVNGHYEPLLGSSYVQFVNLAPSGTTVQGILTYSQSTDPSSPYFGNQVKTYSAKQLYTLPTP
ncbi:penicillin acylase family protein [Noviherbaspirillum pedocola]|uniref:Penicillin acylase family protein n=1 Tax=Noviherbaspirillum pedocola TaxID=2801341 RepID=A0A934SVN2_9BURK|nr:penicillin acylase family protein [Noviherbaspirillum pedocola]MBK4736203.1 penicillin acylase family protein [Noviherbaspirillum pedocola]